MDSSTPRTDGQYDRCRRCGATGGLPTASGETPFAFEPERAENRSVSAERSVDLCRTCLFYEAVSTFFR